MNFVFCWKYRYKYYQKIGKNLSGKYSYKRLGLAKQSSIDAIKTLWKTAIQKSVEAIGGLIGNRITDKINEDSSHITWDNYS